MRSVKEFFMGKSKKATPKKKPPIKSVQSVAGAAKAIKRNKRRKQDILDQL